MQVRTGTRDIRADAAVNRYTSTLLGVLFKSCHICVADLIHVAGKFPPCHVLQKDKAKSGSMQSLSSVQTSHAWCGVSQFLLQSALSNVQQSDSIRVP